MLFRSEDDREGTYQDHPRHAPEAEEDELPAQKDGDVHQIHDIPGRME